MKWEDYEKAKKIAHVKEDLSYTVRKMFKLLNSGNDIVIVAMYSDNHLNDTIISTGNEAKEILHACIDARKKEIDQLDKKFEEI